MPRVGQVPERGCVRRDFKMRVAAGGTCIKDSRRKIMTTYYKVTEEELNRIRHDCIYPELNGCPDDCFYHNGEGVCVFNADRMIEKILRTRKIEGE